MNVRIQLSQGLFAIIDDSDQSAVMQFKWCICRGYAVRNIRDKSKRTGRTTQKMHRFLWGLWGMPNTKELDHINRDKLDNRRCNLRAATGSQNQSNTGLRSDNTSGYKGVYWHGDRERWRALLSVNGTRRCVAITRTAESAARIYDMWAREAFGEFAYLNFHEVA